MEAVIDCRAPSEGRQREEEWRQKVELWDCEEKAAKHGFEFS